MKNTSDYIKDECLVLIDRAFNGQSLTFFGEDGNGRYGRSSTPVTARIRAYDIEFDSFSDDPAEIIAKLYIFLDGYDASLYGHAITDENLRINLNMLFGKVPIDSTAWSWAPLHRQGNDSVVLSVDVAQLLSW